MNDINYPGVDATGMGRREFDDMRAEYEKKAKAESTDYLRGYLNRHESSVGRIGRILRKIIPNYEPLEVRVFRNEMTRRLEKEMEVYGNS